MGIFSTINFHLGQFLRPKITLWYTGTEVTEPEVSEKLIHMETLS